jgi:hypothetical protein
MLNTIALEDLPDDGELEHRDPESFSRLTREGDLRLPGKPLTKTA